MTTYSDIRSLARTVDAGEYLVTYTASGLTDDEDTGSRCGLDDAQWSEIAGIMARRNLRTVTDDKGVLVAFDVGARVEAGEGEDHDVGSIVSIDGDHCTVAWESGVTTPYNLSALSTVE